MTPNISVVNQEKYKVTMTYIETHRTNDLQDFQSRNIKTDIIVIII